ncbi:MAG: hypothetical protein OXR73_33020 [Myxococcales bacterium]|nr:hypothetical protein [Myxococcales bacterium]
MSRQGGCRSRRLRVLAGQWVWALAAAVAMASRALATAMERRYRLGTVLSSSGYAVCLRGLLLLSVYGCTAGGRSGDAGVASLDAAVMAEQERDEPIADAALERSRIEGGRSDPRRDAGMTSREREQEPDVVPSAGGEGGAPEAGQDVCASIQCPEHAECAKVEGQASCVCLAGYKGDGLRCYRDECVSSDGDAALTCGVNANCLDPSPRNGDAFCLCDQGFALCPEEGSQGCEIDTLRDRANCGVCGLACAGEFDCIGGLCEQAAARLVVGQATACVFTEPLPRRGAAPVSCWGSNRTGLLLGASPMEPFQASLEPLGVGPIRDLGLAPHHACRVAADEDMVVCWGDNARAQLGNAPRSADPMPVMDGGAPFEPVASGVVPVEGVIAVSAGYAHSCALTSRGGVACWGDNTAGQLGPEGPELDADPQLALSDVPVPVRDPETGQSLSGTAIASRGPLTCILDADMTVRCFGRYGEAGSGLVVPTQIHRPDGTVFTAVQQVVVGGDGLTRGFACGVRQGGEVACWGMHPLHDPEGEPATTAHTVPALSTVSDVAAGRGHVCTIRPDRLIHCWGDNTHGQAVPGDSREFIPVPTGIVPITDAMDVEAGDDFTCVRRWSGRVTCWGNDTEGQLGEPGASPDDLFRDAPGLP